MWSRRRIENLWNYWGLKNPTDQNVSIKYRSLYIWALRTVRVFRPNKMKFRTECSNIIRSYHYTRINSIEKIIVVRAGNVRNVGGHLYCFSNLYRLQSSSFITKQRFNYHLYESFCVSLILVLTWYVFKTLFSIRIEIWKIQIAIKKFSSRQGNCLYGIGMRNKGNIFLKMICIKSHNSKQCDNYFIMSEKTK